MRILDIAGELLQELVYMTASTRGSPETVRVPVRRAPVEGLPSELGGILVASDLQGVAPVVAAEGASQLVGEALVELLVELEAAGLVAPLNTIGVLLAGDLYSEPAARKRGATGDIRNVWRAFARSFRWVAGVAGNHDQFGATARDRERFGREPGIHLLDGQVVELDGLRIGGVSGIIGPLEKHNRRDEEEMLSVLEQVVASSPQVIVLHEGPDCGRGRPGNAAIGQVLAACREPLIICGHVHWPDPLNLGSKRPPGAQRHGARVPPLAP